MNRTTSRRAVLAGIVTAPALAATTALASQNVLTALAAKPDPILAAIAAHRTAYDASCKRSAAYDSCDDDDEIQLDRPRVQVGEDRDGDFSKKTKDEDGWTIRFTYSGPVKPIFSHSIEDIKKSVPHRLSGADRKAWLRPRLADFRSQQRRVDRAHKKSRIGKLEAERDDADDTEFANARELLRIQPTTIAGLAELLRYASEFERSGHAWPDLRGSASFMSLLAASAADTLETLAVQS